MTNLTETHETLAAESQWDFSDLVRCSSTAR